jgi:hypothetical protein
VTGRLSSCVIFGVCDLMRPLFAKVGANFVDKRRLLGRYSSLV